MPVSSAPRVYLAGPMVFYPDPEATFEVMKAICEQEGLEGVAPIDGQASLQGVPPGRPLYTRIVEADFKLMDECDAALICLDPVHGDVEMDTGTAVEVGYLHAKGKPMSGWMSETVAFGDRIRASCGPTSLSAANGAGATSGLERDARGLLVHSAELAQHGMAQMPIEMSGGVVFQSAQWTSAFRDAAKNVAARFPVYARDVPYGEIDFDTIPDGWGSSPEQFEAVSKYMKHWLEYCGMDAYEGYWSEPQGAAFNRVRYLTTTNVWINVASLVKFGDRKVEGGILDDITYPDTMSWLRLLEGLRRILRREGIQYDDKQLRSHLQNDLNYLLGAPTV